VDFAGFARAAGYRVVFGFSDLDIFAQQIAALLRETGPVFVDLKISASGPQERDYARLHGPHVRQAFRDALMAN
jgi:sulfopyruvate decarboxylase subunit beta